MRTWRYLSRRRSWASPAEQERIWAIISGNSQEFTTKDSHEKRGQSRSTPLERCSLCLVVFFGREYFERVQDCTSYGPIRSTPPERSEIGRLPVVFFAMVAANISKSHHLQSVTHGRERWFLLVWLRHYFTDNSYRRARRTTEGSVGRRLSKLLRI